MMSAIAASCSAAGHCCSSKLQPATGLATIASCNLLPALPQQRAVTLYRPCHSNELQRFAGLAAVLRYQELQCNVATYHRSSGG